MNKDQFSKIQKQLVPSKQAIDDLYKRIEDAEKQQSKPKYSLLRYGVALAACFVVVLSVLILKDLNNNKNPLYPSSSSSGEVYIEPKWADKSMVQKFSEISFQNFQYTSSISTQSIINDVQNNLGSTTASGFDVYENNREYRINCELYSIQKINPECAIAVKFEGDEDYYVYHNATYVPATLGDLIDDLNLQDQLQINRFYYQNNAYTIKDSSPVWDLLNKYRTAKNEGESHYSATVFDISIDVPVIGHKNISLSLNADGYLQTNILDTAKSFYIGKDTVNDVIKAMFKNGIKQKMPSSKNDVSSVVME